MKNELYLRFLVVLKHSVGVEGGSIVHLLYIWTRLLTLRWREIKSPESCDINTSLNILSSARFISGEKRRPASNLYRPEAASKTCIQALEMVIFDLKMIFASNQKKCLY